MHGNQGGEISDLTSSSCVCGCVINGVNATAAT